MTTLPDATFERLGRVMACVFKQHPALMEGLTEEGEDENRAVVALEGMARRDGARLIEILLNVAHDQADMMTDLEREFKAALEREKATAEARVLAAEAAAQVREAALKEQVAAAERSKTAMWAEMTRVTASEGVNWVLHQAQEKGWDVVRAEKDREIAALKRELEEARRLLEQKDEKISFLAGRVRDLEDALEAYLEGRGEE